MPRTDTGDAAPRMREEESEERRKVLPIARSAVESWQNHVRDKTVLTVDVEFAAITSDVRGSPYDVPD
eukprot:3179350-Rhodomonas_salina.1